VPGYDIDFAYQNSTLLTTSQFAEDNGAVAAVNGSFFDMDIGGSVCYFEKDDSVISRTRDPEFKWGVSDSIINGAVVLDTNNSFRIEYAKNELIYESSAGEAFVMISGPVLIRDSSAQKLPDMKFASNRHPRTCVGITRESILFVTIDGRSEQAAGMSLYEAQRYLLELGCLDAINLDGGGSTSMWFKDHGVVNDPSDKTGERPVANALLIFKK
jgi:exopolysaccharide biosynthesis protein